MLCFKGIGSFFLWLLLILNDVGLLMFGPLLSLSEVYLFALHLGCWVVEHHVARTNTGSKKPRISLPEPGIPTTSPHA